MRWIDRQAALDEVLAPLGKAPAIAVDTEADSLHSYFDKVCLIQVSTPETDLVIDPLAKVDLARFGAILADRAVRKVMHGADYDVRILQRDFGFTIANLVDTMISAQFLGYEAFGLAALLKRHFGLELDKSHQRADWAQRPLTPKMLEYAATDTHYLIELAAILQAELEKLGRWTWALEEFGRLESIRWTAPERDEEAWRKIKGSNALEPRGMAVLQRLHAWRDTVAREMDRPPFKVLGNEPMLAIAETLPRTEEDLKKVRGVAAFHLRKFGRDLLAVVAAALDVPEGDLPARKPAKPWIRDKELERRVEKLKAVRDRFARELAIDPSLLGARHVLTAIALAEPRTTAALDDIPAMREWQKTLIGPALIEALR